MIVGSKYFFNNIPNFKPKDTDYLYIDDKPKNYKYLKQTRNINDCIFYVNGNLNKKELIDFHIKLNDPYIFGKFLIPEFNQYFNITIEDIKKFIPIFDRIDNKHLYQKQILNYYIKNNDFVLTKKQLDNCYKIYKKYRK